MVLVKCEMCEELIDVPDFKEGYLLICKICAELLSIMKLNDLDSLKTFDKLREIKRE